MTLDTLTLSFSNLQWLLSVAACIYAWLCQRQAADTAEVQALRERIVALEQQIQNIPDGDLVNELAGDMKAMNASLQGIRESLAPLTRSVDRINDFLLNQKV